MDVNPSQENLLTEEMQLMAGIAEVKQRLKTGANWFYWIAGLSLVSTAISLFGGPTVFVVGFSASFIDGIAQYPAETQGWITILVIGLVISLATTGMFAIFGFLANNEKKWAFILGMGLYALDALLVIWAGDVLMFGFHLFALFGLFNGLRALNVLQQIQQKAK